MRAGFLAAGLVALCAGSVAVAQTAPRDTLVLLREIDSDLYDPPRSTARAAGEVIYMMSDTLVALDWDMKTIRPLLAESWDVSPDGKLYTFHLRKDVTFCDGRKMTAADVVYTMNRWLDPATRSPVRWRAGPVKEVRAVDDYTVEYELKEPFSELLYQLTLFFGSIVDRNAVEKLGENFGVQGFNGTGPYCWVSWTPRRDLVLKRHPDYRWGPTLYSNPAPQVENVIWRVIPEGNTRLAALQTGQGDATQYIPLFALDGLKRVPTVKLNNQPNYFWDFFMGFRVNKPVMSDPVVRRAINMAVNKDALVKAFFFGHASPATSYVNPTALDGDAAAEKLMPPYDPAAANKLLDEAGWKRGSDGIRVKGDQRASFLLYGANTAIWSSMMEAVQAELRKIGIEMRIQLFDATISWGKLATQEFDAFVMSYPYLTATDAMSLYFDSNNRPTPNRMNWVNADTDRWLAEAKGAITPEARRVAIGKVQVQMAEENPWVPLVREELWVAGSARTEGVRAHGIYGVGLYKGLDIRLTR